MAQHIPLTNDARQTFRTVLAGQPVRINVWWQSLDKHWYFSLLRPNREVIISAVRLNEQRRPMRAFVTDFKGEILVDGEGAPRRIAWTTGHRLIYIAQGDLN